MGREALLAECHAYKELLSKLKDSNTAEPYKTIQMQFLQKELTKIGYALIMIDVYQGLSNHDLF